MNANIGTLFVRNIDSSIHYYIYFKFSQLDSYVIVILFSAAFPQSQTMRVFTCWLHATTEQVVPTRPTCYWIRLALRLHNASFSRPSAAQTSISKCLVCLTFLQEILEDQFSKFSQENFLGHSAIIPR